MRVVPLRHPYDGHNATADSSGPATTGQGQDSSPAAAEPAPPGREAFVALLTSQMEGNPNWPYPPTA